MSESASEKYFRVLKEKWKRLAEDMAKRQDPDPLWEPPTDEELNTPSIPEGDDKKGQRE